MTDHHRDEFEAALIAKQRNAGFGAALKDEDFVAKWLDGRYCKIEFEYAWWAWQESRRTYRASVLEEAAKACEFISEQRGDGESLACAEAIRELATQTPGCRGTACGTTTGEHSAECVAEHARAVAGLPRA